MVVVLHKKRFITISHIHMFTAQSFEYPQSYILCREHKLTPSTEKVYWKTSEEDMKLGMTLSPSDVCSLKKCILAIYY